MRKAGRLISFGLVLVVGILFASGNPTLAGVPAAPSDLTVEGLSATTFRLTWHDNSYNETGFDVYTCWPIRCAMVPTLPANTTAFTLYVPMLAECMSVFVVAVNSDGFSERSNEVNPFFLDEPSLVATAVSGNRIELSWDDASRCEDRYVIERCEVDFPLCRRGTTGPSLPPNTAAYTDVDVIEGETYAYFVDVIRGEDWILGKFVSSNVVQVIAYAPANLVAMPATASRIDLTWEDGLASEDGYTIARSAYNYVTSQWGAWGTVADVSADTTGYPDGGVASGTLYRYRVRAYRGIALSAWSNVATAVAVAVPPFPPSDLTASSESPSQIDLTWQDNAANETGFKIERKPQGGTYSQIATVDADVTAYSSTGLSSATTYCYRVRAYNGAGHSAYSNESCATTPAVLPIGPSDLGATAFSANRIDITWQDNSNDETGFKIGRKVLGGTFSQIAVVAANTTSYSSVGLSPGTTYCYLVLAYNTAGNSAPSDEACETTSPDGGAPDAIPDEPDSLSAVAGSASWIDLAWVDKSDNEAGFYIERRPQGGIHEQIAMVAASVTGYADTDVDASSTYCYRVRAYNGLGESDYCTEACATTVPNGPSHLAASAMSSSRIDLTWRDNSNDETGFEIECRPQGGSYSQIATVDTDVTAYSSTGLSSATIYCYRVRAYDTTAGNSAYCAEACAIAYAPHLVAVAAGSSRIDLTWDDALNYENGYTVQRRTYAGGAGWGSWMGIVTLPANATDFADLAVTSGGLYQYRVRAYASEAESAWSNEATASATDLPPDAPSGLTADAVFSKRIDLAWQDNADNEEGFKIERAPDGGVYTQIAVVGPNTAGYSSTGLEAGVRYCHRVRAYNALGDSDASNESCATPLDAPPLTGGDVNDDGNIDLLDVRLCARIAQGHVTGTPSQRAAADVDDDGDVDADDVTILSEYVLGIRITLP
jgi:hypothetical protein